MGASVREAGGDMNAVPTIYLVRHGETEWSKSGKHTGRTDIPLTATGEEDGRRLAARLAGLSFSRVFSSPLARARRTAQPPLKLANGSLTPSKRSCQSGSRRTGRTEPASGYIREWLNPKS